MKTITGLLLIIVGVLLGLYVGVWVSFIGGIVDVIHQIRAPELSTMALAWGIAKIFCAGLFGWLSAFVFIVPGWVMLELGD